MGREQIGLKKESLEQPLTIEQSNELLEVELKSFGMRMGGLMQIINKHGGADKVREQMQSPTYGKGIDGEHLKIKEAKERRSLFYGAVIMAAVSAYASQEFADVYNEESAAEVKNVLALQLAEAQQNFFGLLALVSGGAGLAERAQGYFQRKKAQYQITLSKLKARVLGLNPDTFEPLPLTLDEDIPVEQN